MRRAKRGKIETAAESGATRGVAIRGDVLEGNAENGPRVESSGLGVQTRTAGRVPSRATSRHYERAVALVQRPSPDLDAALPHLRAGAQRGDPNCEYALGTWYLFGHGPVTRNVRLGVQLIRRAARSPKDFELRGSALFDLAVSYESGCGLPKNERLAFEAYVAAAIEGDRESIVEVGRCYFHGIGTERNRRLARIWYDRAERLGLEI